MFFHDFYAPIDIGNDRTIIKMIVEEQVLPVKGTIRRAYKLVDIEKYRPSAVVSPKLNSSLKAGTDINISQLFDFVKTFDEKFKYNEPRVNSQSNFHSGSCGGS